MGWTAEETAAVFDAVADRHRMARAMDGLLDSMPAWLAEIQDRKAEMVEK
jgi:hypothetical protein